MFMSYNVMNDASAMLGMIAKRQKALGDNLANVDTPGYTRKDVDFSQELNSAGGSLQTKMSAKFGGTPIYEQNTGEQVNSANEIIELQKNSILYSMASLTSGSYSIIILYTLIKHHSISKMMHYGTQLHGTRR